MAPPKKSTFMIVLSFLVFNPSLIALIVIAALLQSHAVPIEPLAAPMVGESPSSIHRSGEDHTTISGESPCTGRRSDSAIGLLRPLYPGQ